MTTPPTTTPKTDAAPKAAYRDAMFCELVSANFARQLERELAAANRELRTASDELAAAREELAAVKQLVESDQPAWNQPFAVLVEEFPSTILGNFPRQAAEFAVAEHKQRLAKLREDNAALRADKDRLIEAAQGFINRCETTEGQAFYDRVKSELVTLEVAIDAARAANKNDAPQQKSTEGRQ